MLAQLSPEVMLAIPIVNLAVALVAGIAGVVGTIVAARFAWILIKRVLKWVLMIAGGRYFGPGGAAIGYEIGRAVEGGRVNDRNVQRGAAEAFQAPYAQEITPHNARGPSKPPKARRYRRSYHRRPYRRRRYD